MYDHFFVSYTCTLTLVLLNPDISSFENTVDPDQLASDEAIWSGATLLSTLFVYTCFYTTLTIFSTKYLVMCKVYTDVGGIN